MTTNAHNHRHANIMQRRYGFQCNGSKQTNNGFKHRHHSSTALSHLHDSLIDEGEHASILDAVESSGVGDIELREPHLLEGCCLLLCCDGHVLHLLADHLQQKRRE